MALLAAFALEIMQSRHLFAHHGGQALSSRAQSQVLALAFGERDSEILLQVRDLAAVLALTDGIAAGSASDTANRADFDQRP